jgi:hypothetical protein
MNRLITLALALLSFALPAAAQVQEVGTNLSFSGPSSTSLSLPKFDGSLGTLRGVEFGIEIDGEWNEIVTNTGTSTDSVALSWNPSLAGYYPPTAGDIGNAGYAQFGLTIDIPGSGVYSRSIWRPVAYSDTLLPGVPQVFSETVDTSLLYGGTSKDRAVLSAFLGTGNVSLPVTTVGYLATSGAPQSTISTNCFADATVTVRYFYETGAAEMPFGATGSLMSAREPGAMPVHNMPPITTADGCTVVYFQVLSFTLGECWEFDYSVGTQYYYTCKSGGDDCDVLLTGNPNYGQLDYNVTMDCGTQHMFTFDRSDDTAWFDSYSCQ